METRAIETQLTRQGREVRGYAAVYNQVATLRDKVTGKQFREVIRPGAFKSAPTRDVRLLNSHVPTPVYARTRSGTLALTDDNKGLAFLAKLGETEAVKERLSEITRQDISGMSFGWGDGLVDRWSYVDGMPFRELIEIPIHEISFTGFPVYDTTSIDLRSIQFEAGYSPNEIMKLRQRLFETFF